MCANKHTVCSDAETGTASIFEQKLVNWFHCERFLKIELFAEEFFADGSSRIPRFSRG